MTDDLGGELVRDPLWFDEGFTTIPNTWARDAHISNQSRGLLVQIASHKAGFRIKLAVLVAGSLNGREAIRSQLSELQAAGYLTRSSYRDGNLRRYRYRLRDPHAPFGADGQASFPVDNSPESVDKKGVSPRSGFRASGNPDAGKPVDRKPDPYKNTKKEQLNNVLETTTENATQPVDNTPKAGYCLKGHRLVKDQLFCDLGHYSHERTGTS